MTLEDRVEELLSQLTLREKVSLLSGLNNWETTPVKRLGIPSLVMTDGPHGVRANQTGPERVQGEATSFPTGVSMAASWDTDLVERVGEALAEETRALGCDILLGPCVNIVRTPLAGRNFESYSEDPYLAGRIGVAWVTGLQSRGVGASLKHYACNNQEEERFRGNSIVDERALREIYLAQFETVVKEAQPWTVMCSYNRINGDYASENYYLLTHILKEEWGFEGVVVSDWGANHTIVESVAGGLDIEMPGPARYYGRFLEDAVRNWQIDAASVDEAARRVLRMIVLSGRMDSPARIPAGSLNTPEHQSLARELAEDSITLLKNTGVLPLKGVKTLAVIGPNAAECRIGGGGSSYLEPPYRVSPLEGLRAALPDVGIVYAEGCDNYVEAPALKNEWLKPAQGEGCGLWGEFFNNTTFDGAPAAARLERQLDHWWFTGPEGVNYAAFSARWRGALTVPESGRYIFKMRVAGSCTLSLDGKERLAVTGGNAWEGSSAETAIELEAGRSYAITVEWVKPLEAEHRMIYVQAMFAPDPDDRRAQAVVAAQSSDAALIFAGMPTGYESEGRDRPHMKLPGAQDELIREVAAVNPNTIVVLNAGSPVEMPWAGDVAAIVLAYYPGQEGGNAVARVLAGAVNPSGKLSETFPQRYADNPASINYPGTKDVVYGEGLFVGYRYYDAKDVAPLFPFGHGLSYTTFAYSGLKLPATVKPGKPVTVKVTVKNTGAVAGKEVVQLYVADKAASLVRPQKELKRFAKIALEPGASQTVTFILDERALAFYDPYKGDWVAELGEFAVLIGSSSRDIRLAGTFVVEA